MKPKNKNKIENQTNAMILWLRFKKDEKQWKKYWINHYNMLGFVCVVQTVENTFEDGEEKMEKREKPNFPAFHFVVIFALNFWRFSF